MKKDGKITKENAKEYQAKSAQARRRNAQERKAFKEIFDELLNERGGTYNGEEISKKQAIAIKALGYLLDKDANLDEARAYMYAFEKVRDTVGEKPMEKVAVAGLDDEKAKLDELINQRKERNEGKR